MDRHDKRILSLLQKNARLNADSVSEEIELSAAAARKRIRRLRKNRAVPDFFKKRIRAEPLVRQCR